MSSPRRMALLAALAVLLGLAGGAAAWVLVHLIGLITNVRCSTSGDGRCRRSPSWTRGPLVVVAAVTGALVVIAAGAVGAGRSAATASPRRWRRSSPARAGSRRGRRWPSRSPPPSPSAPARPFGAEGPIIVTGGSLGSLLGQVVHVSPSERKMLLAVRRGRGHVGDVRRAAGRRGAGDRAAAVRVLGPRVRPARRRGERRRRHARRAVRGRAALRGARPRLRRPRRPARRSCCSAWRCGCSRSSSAAGLFLVEAATGACPSASSGTPSSAPSGFATVGLFVPRALGVGYDAIGDILDDRLAWHDRGRAGRRQADRLVARAGLGHLGRDAGADPADQRAGSAACSAASAATSFPGSTWRPARSRSSPWRPPSARRPGPPSPPSCSCSSSPATTSVDPAAHAGDRRGRPRVAGALQPATAS